MSNSHLAFSPNNNNLDITQIIVIGILTLGMSVVVF